MTVELDARAWRRTYVFERRSLGLSGDGQSRMLLGALMAVIVALAAAELARSFHLTDRGYRVLNAVFPLMVLGGFLGMALASIARAPVLIWTPMVMFFLHMALFRGLGPLVYVFGSDATQARIWGGAWGLTPAELFATHELNLVGAAAVLVGLCLVPGRSEANPRQVVRAARAHGAQAAALILLVVGAGVRYGLVIPATFGAADLQLPGVVLKLRILLDLAFALIAYLAVRGGRGWALAFWLLFPPHFLSLALEFKKSAIAVGLMLPTLGAYLGNENLRLLVARGAAIAGLVVALHPVVTQARAEMEAVSGSSFGATVSQRLAILERVILGQTAGTAAKQTPKPEQVGWIRLSYAAQQAIAMRAYDAGQARDTVSGAWQVLVPRAIWPDKPDFTSFARDFYQSITGGSGTLVGLTIFADGYWNAGWAGVLVIGILAGVFFGLASRFAVTTLTTRDFALLPAVFLAMDMALREMNGWILPSLAGELPFFLAYVGLVRVARTFARARG